MTERLYFAYGSNINLEQMADPLSCRSSGWTCGAGRL